ncbi:MAG: histone [Candidatus Woesearchaeota archaeon]
MPKNKTLIAKAPLQRLIKQVGVNRISDKGVEQLRMYIEKQTQTLAKKSIELAKHSGRNTILIDDVYQAR